MRVVSLLPSATEILCAVGGEPLLVGRSHECDWPESVRDRPVLTAQRTRAAASAAIDEEVRGALAEGGSLYTLDQDLLRALQPDVILTQDLCDVCSIDLETVRAVASSLDPAPAIVSLNPKTLEDVFDDLLRVGAAVGLERAAERALVELRERYHAARDFVNPYLEGPEVAFLEWLDPLFVGGHWTPQMIQEAGGRHSLNGPGLASRRIEPAELIASEPQRIILCPCGYSIPETRRDLGVLTSQEWWRDLPAVRAGQVVIVDGNQMFNRPGPRLVDAFCWLVGWLNDREETIPPGFPAVGLDAG